MNLKKTTIGLLTLTLMLSACGGSVEPTEYSSNSGLVPEQFMPAEAPVVAAYSNRDDAQAAALANIETVLGDDSRVEDVIAEALATQFPDSELTSETVMEAFGEQYRMVLSMSRGAADEARVHVASTLEDADKMEETLNALVEEKALEAKKLSKVQAYVDEKNELYLAIHEDLLLGANTPETLVAMMEQDEETSLWESDAYQDSLSDMGGQPLFYGLMFPSQLGNLDEIVPEAGGIAGAIERQMVVVNAEMDGVRFDYFSKADKQALKEADFDFTAVPKKEAYLFEEVPAEGLMAYMESYGLQQSVERAQSLSEGEAGVAELNTTLQAYTGLDLDELLSFMDKGYSIALHANGEGVVPGISLYMDVSSEEALAEALVEKLDQQISGLLLILESALPGAVSMETVDWNGAEISNLSIDLSAIEQEEHSPLPVAVTASEIQLFYGVADERFILSTASAWLDSKESVQESELYMTLEAQLDGVQDGLILLDAQGVSQFVGSLRALREQLDLGVSDSSIEFETLLEGFTGAIAASDTQAYESHIGGFLMLAE